MNFNILLEKDSKRVFKMKSAREINVRKVEKETGIKMQSLRDQNARNSKVEVHRLMAWRACAKRHEKME